MKKTSFILCFILVFVTQIRAGEEIEMTITTPRLRIGIEAGFNYFNGFLNKPAMIRENQSYYSDNDHYYYGGFISQRKGVMFYYLGIRPEYTINKRVSVSAGLRVSLNSVMLNSDREYFLWKISETETSTNYIRIKEMAQKNVYAGIPLELKVFPREWDFQVRHYCVVGTTLNFLLVSDNSVLFVDPQMRKYTSDVMHSFEKPDNFFVAFYAGFGLKIGNIHRPCGQIEIQFPVFHYGGHINSFARIVNMDGFGLRTILQIPVASERQLTYKVTRDINND